MALLNTVLLVILTALAPVSEVRGAIPLAYILAPDDHSKWVMVALAVGCNALLPFSLLSVLQFVEDILLKSGDGLLEGLARVYMRLVSRARMQGAKYLRRWGYLGLAVFVAIPLPATGAWTASLVAHVFGLNKLKSSLAIVVGVLVASAIVILALEGIITAVNTF
ncbi:MAG: small multi-drug export protein [Zestosphaera sp.]